MAHVQVRHLVYRMNNVPALVSCSVPMIKCPDKSHLRVKVLTLAHGLRGRVHRGEK